MTRPATIAVFVAATLIGCETVEKAKPQPESVKVDRSFQIDAPQIMRGTVSAEAVLLGYENTSSDEYQPVVARGYGLVVGLYGTGSRDIPPQVRAYMLAQASKYGFGSPKFGPQVQAMTPEQLLNSADTAVVIVEAVIPQGATKGTKFDVRVYADPRTGTTSLEGGRLYTADLRPGPVTAGGAEAFALAQASGPVFVNPFAEPGAVGRDTVNRISGRILNGGVVMEDMPLKLRLASPSHTRAAILITAINSRFPQEPGQADPTARGESDETVEITVPPSYRDRTDVFVDRLRHTTITQSNPEGIAMSIRRVLLANPAVGQAASLRWQALGTRALPIIKELYDYPEEAPRMAALEAGAKLNHALVIPHLITMAKTGSFDTRIGAINLLGGMDPNPQIDQALRLLLDDDDVEVRLQSYEALVKRRDPYLRRNVVDDKYVVDVVESTKPMIYITQVGTPRIVIFGRDLRIHQPITVTAWSNRFMVKADETDELVEVYYRGERESQGVIQRISPNLEEFVSFLGHMTTVEHPEPGLGLSYSEAVGALHQVWLQKYIQADFKAEQDRILAAIVRREGSKTLEERPEFMENPDDLAPRPTDLDQVAPPPIPGTPEAPRSDQRVNPTPRPG